MLQYDPAHRPTMTEVAAHPWINMPILSPQKIRSNFKFRKEEITARKEAEKSG
jgi:hypothetical protein